MQLPALQLSDRWAPAVQRTTRPLAKPVQIARGLVATFARTAPPVTEVREHAPPPNTVDITNILQPYSVARME